jgi:hypothetical protein
MTSKESVEDFVRRGGVIQVLDPEPDPPIIIKPRYGSAQKKHFMEGDKSFSHIRKKKGAVRYGRCS